MNKTYCYTLLLITMIFCKGIFGQTKPTIINEYVTGSEDVMSDDKNFNPKPLGGSCWKELDAEFVNVNNVLYGNEGYSSANPLDDGSFGPINLGWTFTFYGQTYNSVYVNVNGNVTFGDLHSAYSARGFPSSSVPAMIAPFWGDVDLRGAGSGANKMYIKEEEGKISIQWVGVGYYNQKTNVTNSFQLVLSDGNDDEIGIGKNTMFLYDDMNWCVGDASGGTNGFGSNVYATVGAQAAGGTEFYQIGLFGKDNLDYDGAGGSLDGVHYLDGRCFAMDLSQNNVPPIANNLPNNRRVELCPGMMYSLESSFSAPEVSQSALTTVSNSTLTDFTYTSSIGNLSVQTITINPTQADTGMHYVAYVATDDGTPSASTYDTLWVHVYDCGNEGSSSSLNFDGQDDYSVVHHHPALYSGGTNTYSMWIRPEVQNSEGPINIFQKEGQFKLGIVGSSLIPFAKIMIDEFEHSVYSSEAVMSDEWTHVCAVAEPTELKIYINGKLKGGVSIPGTIDVTNNPLYVAGKENSETYYQGRLDELALISKACSDAEVKQLRWELASIDSKYLRAYFKCTSDVVLTNSTNPYHGTLINMTDPNKWKNNYGKIWNGAVSSEFSNPQNWVEGIPPVLSSGGGVEEDAFVIFDDKSEGGFHLDLNDVQEVNTVVFTQNSSPSVSTNGQLRVHKDMLSFTSPVLEGEVLFTGVDEQTIYGVNEFEKLNINNDVKLLSDQILKGSLILSTGVFDVNGFDFTVSSDGESNGQIFHNSGSINGDVIMERVMTYDSSAIGWHYISTPMENLTISDLQQGLQIIGLGTTVHSNPFPSLFYYNESVVDQDLIKGWEPPATFTSSFESLTGYIYYKYRHEQEKLKLKGKVFTGAKSKYLTYSNSGSENADGWHLMGNPYPSAINWDLVDVPASMDNALYIYNSKTDLYETYVDGIGVNGSSSNVPTMTSYFVHVNSPTTFSLDNSVRTVAPDTRHLKTAKSSGFVLTLELTAGSHTDQTIIRIREGSSVGFDSKFDAYKLMSSTGTNIYSMVSNKNLSINSVDNFNEEISIPVELSTKASAFSLKIITSNEWIDTYTAVLVSQNNKEYMLTEGMNFAVQSADDFSRNYSLVLKPKQPTSFDYNNEKEGGLSIFAYGGFLVIGEGTGFHSFKLYSKEGRLVHQGSLLRAENTVVSYGKLNLGSQVVLVKLIGANNVRYERVLLR